MAVAAMQPQSMSQLQRHPGPSGLAEVLDVILDKGIVIDVYVRVALVGIELLTVDARIVIASVDTYLRFAEAVNRLDLTQVGSQETLPEMVGDLTEGGAGNKTKGILEGAKDALFGSGDDDDDDAPGREGSTRQLGGKGGRLSRHCPPHRTPPPPLSTARRSQHGDGGMARQGDGGAYVSGLPGGASASDAGSGSWSPASFPRTPRAARCAGASVRGDPSRYSSWNSTRGDTAGRLKDSSATLNRGRQQC